jgi:hypothetical protein
MCLEFIPRSQLVQHIEAGWSLIPGYEYKAEDYAILLALLPNAKQPSPDEVTELKRRFLLGQLTLIDIMTAPEKPKKNRPRYSKLSSLAKYKAVTGLDWIEPVTPPTPIKYCMAMGCYRDVCARGYCAKHYKRLQIHGDAEIVTIREPKKHCSIDGCGGAHKAKGYCGKHAWRYYKHGDPNVTIDVKGRRQSSEHVANRISTRHFYKQAECVQA